MEPANTSFFKRRNKHRSKTTQLIGHVRFCGDDVPSWPTTKTPPLTPPPTDTHGKPRNPRGFRVSRLSIKTRASAEAHRGIGGGIAFILRGLRHLDGPDDGSDRISG